MIVITYMFFNWEYVSAAYILLGLNIWLRSCKSCDVISSSLTSNRSRI